jgi:light-regulated signal transduction histidine kinase (bacteriophytochrome)
LKAYSNEKNIIEQISDTTARPSELFVEPIAVDFQEQLEQFIYIASHDLRSPLRNIGSYAQLLKKKFSSDLEPEAHEFLEFIVSNAFLMNEIINDLLEYSNLDRQTPNSRVNLNRIMDLVNVNFEDRITEKGLTIEIDELPIIMGKKSPLIKLFSNLTDNALKFSSQSAAPHLQIKCQKYNKQFWLFSFIDNGVGLEEIYQDKVFQPFQKIDTRKLGGSGMGLAICKKVVKLHGGSIWYTPNHQGAGTTFNFTLPQYLAY